MIKKLTTIICLISSGIVSFAQIQATFDLKKFSSENSSYIETYLEIYSNSLNIYSLDSINKKVGIEIIQFIKNSNSEIIDHDKYIIEQTIIKDSILENILDLQRFSLNNGRYTIEIEIKDLYGDHPAQNYQENFEINFPENEICVSDIELLDYFWRTDEINETTKSGYSLIPLVTDYLGPEFNKLAYYFEIYNADKEFGNEESFVLLQSIKIKETGNIAGQFNKVKKVKANTILPLINTFNIDNLPTGNYELVIQIRDKLNALIIEKKLDFQRTNLNANMNLDFLSSVSISNSFCSFLPSDSLTEFIECLSPIASPNELIIIDKKLNKMSDSIKRQFFYSFWHQQNNIEPGKAWEDYKIQVKRINQLFSTTVRKGYQTDRGRIYLKYGAPNNIIDRPNEPSAYPYQIWHYYKLGKFNNKRFIFYMPDLVTNEYTILHSDVPGEFFNSKWENVLNSRNTTRGNIGEDQNGNTNHWGSNSSVLFKNP